MSNKPILSNIQKVRALSNIQKVRALYEQIAGDKLSLCDEVAGKLMDRGVKAERAWADALDKFKLVKNDKVED